jgi:hypothetical protein
MNCPAYLRQRVLTLLLAVSLLSVTGCYHVYQAGGPEGRELGNQPGTEWSSKTGHALAWGIFRPDIPVTNCVLANGDRLGIEEIKVETNVGYVIVSVVTLGFWVPVDVSWRCAKPKVATGTL